MIALLVSLLAAAPPPARIPRLFVELDVGLPGKAATAVAISPASDKIILVGVDGMLFRSTNGGADWDVVLKPGNKGGLTVEEQLAMEDAAEETQEEGSEGGTDPGSFQPDLDATEIDSAIEDLQEDIQQSLEADKQGGDSALPEGDQEVGTDGPPPSARVNPGIRRVVFVNAETVVVATHRGLFRSTDSGHTFEPVPLPASGPVRNVRDVAVAPNVPTFIVATTAGGTLLSRDGGLTWLPAAGPAGSAPGLSCAIGPGARPTVVVGTPYGLARSLDGGRTFDAVSLPGEASSRAVLSVAIDPAEDRLFAVTPTMLFSGAPSTRTLSPTGAGWRAGLATVHTQPGRGNTLWGGGRSGVFLSGDGGRTAEEVGAESMVRDVVDVAVGTQDGDLVAVATASGALIHTRVDRAPRGLNPRLALELLSSQEPTVSEVAEWAVLYHRVSPEVTRGMARRVRAAGLAPRLVLDAQSAINNPLPNYAPWESYSRYVQNPGVQGALVVNVTFPLDTLVVRAEERFVMREQRRLLKERERVFKRVIRTYEQRRRTQAEMLANGSKSAGVWARKRLRLDQLTAVLDAQTGGRFSLEARRRGAPGDGISVRVESADGQKKE